MSDKHLKKNVKGRHGATRNQAPTGWRAVAYRWGKRIAMVVFTLSTVSVVYLLSQSMKGQLNWSVAKVVVKGEYQHINKTELVDMIQPYMSASFLSMNLHEIKERLEAEPTIYRAMIERQWPDKLVVSIVEQTPYAKWGEDALLNIEGEVFERADSFAEANRSLPNLHGPEGSNKQVLAVYKTIVDKFKAIDVGLTTLYRDEKGAHRAILSTGMELNIGKDDIHARVDRFVQVYTQQLKQQVKRIAVVDLRYSNGVAVKWNQARPDTDVSRLQPALAER